MPIEYRTDRAVFAEAVGVEDAEDLLRWLADNGCPTVDLSACTHLHPANLQVLMAAKPGIAAWPRDPAWRSWLESALNPTQGDM